MDLLSDCPDSACIIDLGTGEIRRYNRMFSADLEYEADDLAEASLGDVLAEQDASDLRERVAGAGREGIRNWSIPVETADGDAFEVLVSARRLESGEHDAERAWVTFRDISELRETQRQLEEQKRRLEQSNEELEQFAYLASHDLQEPLRMVASYTELLARRYEDELDEQAQKYIDYAVDGAERMKELINDLLQYSRVGRRGDDFGEVDLEEVLETVEGQLRLRIAEEGAELEWAELPEVYGSKSQLTKVFQNLVENALKFNDSEDPRVRIDAVPADEEGRVSVRVADNGIGFDEDHAGRIFQVFQRLNERSDYEGTGIGLAIVKKVVERHGGDLAVESTPGEGTTFEFDLEVVE